MTKTHKEWDESSDHQDTITLLNMFADWTEDRKLQRAINTKVARKLAEKEEKVEHLQAEVKRLCNLVHDRRDKINELISRAGVAEANQALIWEALIGLMVFENDTDAVGTEWHDGHKNAVRYANDVIEKLENKNGV